MRTVRVSVGEIAVCVSLPSSSNNASLAESVVASTGAIGDDKVAEAKLSGQSTRPRTNFAIAHSL